MEPHDEQQARVVERLRAADGAPVSFAELREMGVENPALLCYELAAVGLEIERPRDARGALALSVRLQPPRNGPEHAGQPVTARRLDGNERTRAAEPLLARSPTPLLQGLRLSGFPRPSASRPRLLALAGAALALVAAAAVALALAPGAHSGRRITSLSAEHRREHAHPRQASTGATRSQQAQRAGASANRATQAAAVVGGAQTRRVPVSVSAAAAFEADGHQLLEAGRYAAAIGRLRSAIQASGGSVSRCAEPSSEACLTFAYALYDLGRALQLDGDSAAAVPVLSERLRIANQRETVQQELDLARAAGAS